jgi:hypothetical protein
MVNSTQIRHNYKTQYPKPICFRLEDRGGRHTMLCSLETADHGQILKTQLFWALKLEFPM